MTEQDNNASFFRFEDLRIYAKAMDYITWLYQEMKNSFDSDTVTFLKQNFLKSANEIALNTAEGSSRNKAQFLYYLKLAKSSVRECVVFTETAGRLELFNAEAKAHSRNQLMELTKMIGSLIASLQRTSTGTVQNDKIEDAIDPIPDFDTL